MYAKAGGGGFQGLNCNYEQYIQGISSAIVYQRSLLWVQLANDHISGHKSAFKPSHEQSSAVLELGEFS